MNGITIDSDAVVTQALDLVAGNMDGETVMLNIQSEKYYGLDTISSRIWDLIATPRRISELVDILTNEYDATPLQCQSDTVELLNYLCREGLVRIV